MTTSHDSALAWITAGTTATVDALVLRFGAVLNGLFTEVLDEGGEWFLIDLSGHLVDCTVDSDGATALLGSHLTRIAGPDAKGPLSEAWVQVLNGRAQTVWPWHGGRARAAMRSIELHPIRDVLTDDAPVVGALMVFVDSQTQSSSLRAAA
jgi:hypothetical protein